MLALKLSPSQELWYILDWSTRLAPEEEHSSFRFFPEVVKLFLSVFLRMCWSGIEVEETHWRIENFNFYVFYGVSGFSICVLLSYIYLIYLHYLLLLGWDLHIGRLSETWDECWDVTSSCCHFTNSQETVPDLHYGNLAFLTLNRRHHDQLAPLVCVVWRAVTENKTGCEGALYCILRVLTKTDTRIF